MQRYTIKMSVLAGRDLEHIGDYIAYELLNPQASLNTVKGIRKQMRKLQYFPERHELDTDPILAECGVHKIYFKEYKIFYTIDKEDDIVNVVRILHRLADSRSWLSRTLEIT